MLISVDQNNRFLANEFRIEGDRIEKTRKYGRYQILSKEVIPPVGKHYFVLYIHKISYQIFSFGIVSQKRRNFPNSHENKDLISYFAKTGAFWEYSETGEMPCRTGGSRIPNGVEIRVVIDMSKYSVVLFMDRR